MRCTIANRSRYLPSLIILRAANTASTPRSFSSSLHIGEIRHERFCQGVERSVGCVGDSLVANFVRPQGGGRRSWNNERKPVDMCTIVFTSTTTGPSNCRSEDGAGVLPGATPPGERLPWYLLPAYPYLTLPHLTYCVLGQKPVWGCCLMRFPQLSCATPTMLTRDIGPHSRIGPSRRSCNQHRCRRSESADNT